jgi:hypothetical protein
LDFARTLLQCGQNGLWKLSADMSAKCWLRKNLKEISDEIRRLKTTPPREALAGFLKDHPEVRDLPTPSPEIDSTPSKRWIVQPATEESTDLKVLAALGAFDKMATGKADYTPQCGCDAIPV